MVWYIADESVVLWVVTLCSYWHTGSNMWKKPPALTCRVDKAAGRSEILGHIYQSTKCHTGSAVEIFSLACSCGLWFEHSCTLEGMCVTARREVVSTISILELSHGLFDKGLNSFMVHPKHIEANGPNMASCLYTIEQTYWL